ncbi:hypothetical protein DFA_03948 [Cavenderia fasciculata]|uniref:SAM domain-containing protein n=1 Tax=Cavenderia fasciculata TaxID=261658 RepID=F4Q0V3_CACFS|nr:uncharacterized protein DFA_03948 [Cavenderia fasciculata]EGG18454.1 hypothetical protein DFA_03948 [Cavenderia fasciculata]|eukprot:XP_004366358.1 hypothetical protein DFA_03948 [Cavenderia fasciculata]
MYNALTIAEIASQSDFKRWSAKQVKEWATKEVQVREEYAQMLLDNDVDGESIAVFTEADFGKCGIVVAPAKKLYLAAQQLLIKQQQSLSHQHSSSRANIFVLFAHDCHSSDSLLRNECILKLYLLHVVCIVLFYLFLILMVSVFASCLQSSSSSHAFFRFRADRQNSYSKSLLLEFDRAALLQATIPKSFYTVGRGLNTFELIEDAQSLQDTLEKQLNALSPNNVKYAISWPTSQQPNTGKYGDDDILQEVYSAASNADFSNIHWQNYDVESYSKQLVSNSKTSFTIYLTDQDGNEVNLNGKKNH